MGNTDPEGSRSENVTEKGNLELERVEARRMTRLVLVEVRSRELWMSASGKKLRQNQD